VSALIDLLDPKCADIIAATVRKAEERFGVPVRVIGLDTIAKGVAAGGGDEDKAKDQNLVAADMKRIHELLPGVHIAGIGHTGKDESRGERGSNARLADVDLAVQLSGDGNVKTATVIAANDQPTGPLTAFAMEEVVVGADDDGDEITLAILSPKLFSCDTAKKTTRLGVWKWMEGSTKWKDQIDE
jgi:hypothetical protein